MQSPQESNKLLMFFFRHCGSFGFLGFTKADEVWFHTSCAESGQTVPYHEGQNHKHKPSARSSAKTKVIMEEKKAVCVCVYVLSDMEKSRSVCAHLCLCQCSMHSFVMTWQVWLPAVVQVFPLVAAVWLPVSPHKKLQVRECGDCRAAHQWSTNLWGTD